VSTKGRGKWNTYLIRTQLVVISLVRKEDAKLHWEHPISAGLNQRKKPELQVNIVLALVVVVNGDDFLSLSTWNTGLGLESEGGVLGIHTIHEIFRILAIKGKALDGVDLLVCEDLANANFSISRELTACLATMLNKELQLGHLSKVLEVFGLCDTIAVLDRLQEIAEDSVRELAVAILAIVAGSLVQILRGPECAVGNINIESQTSAGSADRRLGLGIVSCWIDQDGAGKLTSHKRIEVYTPFMATMQLSIWKLVLPRLKKLRLIWVYCSDGHWRIT
jgi:hypothetical protein